MQRFADVSYFKRSEENLGQGIRKLKPAFNYLQFLKRYFHCEVVLHGRTNGSVNIDGITYSGFKGSSSFFHIPWRAHKYLSAVKPNVVLVQGLIFPVQVILLRWRMGKKPVIIVQHHGEKPFVNGVKRYFQKIADRYIDGYFFTSNANADVWVHAGVIAGKEKCFEVLECSTELMPKDKTASKQKTGMTGDDNFLWVGRLNANKDPLTVLQGFRKYLAVCPGARLYMIYQDNDLLDAVKEQLVNDSILDSAVKLVGRVAHDELAEWYSATDFYISGSHSEGSGYALIEAMACGCIPIVTDIPSFRTITGNGQYAYLYRAGDAESLFSALNSVEAGRKVLSENIRQYFNSHLSFSSIGEAIYSHCKQLLKKN